MAGIKPVTCVADAIRDIKSFSSRYINENRLVKCHFEWQTGYGAFSYGQSQIEGVKSYIRNQHNHHKKITFKEEYMGVFQIVAFPFLHIPLGMYCSVAKDHLY